MRKGEKILRIVCTTLKILGWIGIGLGVISFFIILIGGGGPGSPRTMSIVALLIGVIYFCLFWTIASIAELLIDIRDNTRRSIS